MTGTRGHRRRRIRSNPRRWFWPAPHRTAHDVATVLDRCMARLGFSPAYGMDGIAVGAVSAGHATLDGMCPGSLESSVWTGNRAWTAYNTGSLLTHGKCHCHRPALNFKCGTENRRVSADGTIRFTVRPSDIYAGTPGAATGSAASGCRAPLHG